MKNQFLKYLFILLNLAYGLNGSAQEWKDLGADELFQLARQEAFDGKREEAREKLKVILETSPDYADVRILLGRTYAWDDRYAEAIEAFKIVLEKDPKNNDAINAMIDAYMWNSEYESALKTANMGLSKYPNFEDFLYKKASALNNLERFEESMAEVNQLLIINQSHEKGLALRDEIKTGQQRYTLTLNTSADRFSEFYDPALYSSLQFGRSNNWGSSIARLNYSRRFKKSGIQGEIDLYPNIYKGIYGYFNYGFSKSGLYPNHRFGGEVFTKLPKSTEGSFGARYLVFGANTKILMFTGSIGWYYKSMWFSLRPFITPDKAAGTSFSIGASTRRYFSNPQTYVGLSGGIGYSPEIRTLQSAEGLATNELFTLKSQRVGISGQKLFRYNLLGSIDANFAHQQVAFPGTYKYIWITSISGSMAFKF